MLWHFGHQFHPKLWLQLEGWDLELAAQPKWGPAMQANQAPAVFAVERYRREVEYESPPLSIALNSDIIDRAAQALFEFVFSSCGRLDGKQQWATCEESTKEGFRGEAAAVIVAAWPFLFR